MPGPIATGPARRPTISMTVQSTDREPSSRPTVVLPSLISVDVRSLILPGPCTTAITSHCSWSSGDIRVLSYTSSSAAFTFAA